MSERITTDTRTDYTSISRCKLCEASLRNTYSSKTLYKNYERRAVTAEYCPDCWIERCTDQGLDAETTTKATMLARDAADPPSVSRSPIQAAVGIGSL